MGAGHLTSGQLVKSYEQKWEIQPTTPGSRFVFKEDIELPLGILGKALGLFARKRSETIVDQMLGKLKNLVEVQGA